MPLIKADWRALTATERDIMVVLALEEGAVGHRVHECLRGDEPTTRSTTLRALVSLRDAGLVESEEIDGRSKRNELTSKGWALVYENVVNRGEDILAQEPR